MLYDGDIIEHDGARFRVEFPFDDSDGTPWENDDGHGEVSDWKRHAFGQGSKPPKRPGELILCWDHGSYRTYDFKGACEIARRDGWGWLPGIAPNKGRLEPLLKSLELRMRNYIIGIHRATPRLGARTGSSVASTLPSALTYHTPAFTQAAFDRLRER